MSELAADGIAVAVTCRVLKFAKQPHYRWLADPVTKRDWDEAQLINAAIDIHVPIYRGRGESEAKLHALGVRIRELL